MYNTSGRMEPDHYISFIETQPTLMFQVPPPFLAMKHSYESSDSKFVLNTLY